MGEERKSEVPLFQRVRADGEPMAELRMNVPRWWLDVFDGLAHAAGDAHRSDLIGRILQREIESELHRIMMVRRCAGANPRVSEVLAGERRDG